MTHEEIIALIRAGVSESQGIWADLGAGSGNFTRALRQLLGTKATIYAVDKDQRALTQLQRRVTPPIRIINADFTTPLDLPPLDGIVMANALHWVGRQKQILTNLVKHLKSNAPLIIVEYDVTIPRAYIPRPVPYTHFETLALSAGLHNIAQIGNRKSPSTGVTMYAGIAIKV